MRQFAAIEGLRGWLAWTVVLSHLAQITNLHGGGIGPPLLKAGGVAVMVFIIVSGFVITHLIIEKPEPYRVYIVRRFMRIFPLFAVTCAAGYFANEALATTIPQLPWCKEPSFWLATHVAEVVQSHHEHFWAHVAAHAVMLHGAISDNVLPQSASAFNGPAWSLSLEWQFYLLAPIAVALAAKQRSLLALAVAVAAGHIAFRLGVFGKFEFPSLILGASGYFTVGIVSRLCFPMIKGKVSQPLIIFALGIALLPIVGIPAAPILVWTLIMTGMALDKFESAAFAKAFRVALEGLVPTWLGSRSYSTYLCHPLVLAACIWTWSKLFPDASKLATFIGVGLVLIPLTLILAEVLYRTIERPGIALGARLAARLRARPAPGAIPAQSMPTT